MDFDEIFNECAAEPQNNIETPGSYSFSQHIIDEVEAQYTGKNTEIVDRNKEIINLKKEIASHKDAIKRIKIPKGVGNTKNRDKLAKQASEKREVLRNKIKRAQCRLDEIDIETNGSLSKQKEIESKSENKFDGKTKNEWGPLNPYADF